VAVERLAADVVVVGGGVAALRAAVAAREAGADTLVCCKSVVGRSGNTVVSTADISAYVGALGPDDSEETYAEDTLGSGGRIADDRLVQVLAERSGPALLELERLGIPLLRSEGAIDRTRAAGHSRARTYRADSTGLGPNKGLALSVPLAQRARDLGVRCLDRTPVVSLTVCDGSVAGAVAVDLQSSTVLAISAPSVVLAAGGASHLFARTNGTVDATGDVIAIALRAGAVARDMEFVQWHPTRMDEPVPLFLSNGLLADGAIFRDTAGRAFMREYDARADLAPRDVLAKAVFTEARSGRGVNGGVYLDCSAILPERITLRHGHIADILKRHGVDFPRQWLVVSPATHFLMGGIAIDERAASSLDGVFVAGETAGGIHGANRLGGNAFCEGLVFGTIAGQSAATRANGERSRPVTADEGARAFEEAVDGGARDPRPELGQIWQALRQTMWDRASIVRDGAGLHTAAADLERLVREAAMLRGRTAAEGARVLDLRAGLDCARVIVTAAIFREESRGAHWRADFPETLERWFGHVTVAWPAERGQPCLTFHPKREAAGAPPHPNPPPPGGRERRQHPNPYPPGGGGKILPSPSMGEG
jgi:succinate dehydrogenase/fumarate reductase flavoprotein subunit